MIKVVFIDWNKTLSYDLFWGHLQDVSHPNHAHLASIERWLFVENRNKINPWMRGEISVDDIISQMSQDTGIDDGLIMNELRRSCEIMTYSLEGLEELVLSIKNKGIKVVIATDNMDTFSRFTVPALKLDAIFDGILNSYELGYLKDDEQPMDAIPFFDAYLEANGLSYENALLLDDSPDKTNKYSRLGFERIIIGSPDVLRVSLERLADAKEA